MDERMLKAMVAAGAIKNIKIIASGARFHIEAKTPNGPITAETRKRKVRTWATLDAAARWVRRLGVGAAQVNFAHWPAGSELPLDRSTLLRGYRRAIHRPTEMVSRQY